MPRRKEPRIPDALLDQLLSGAGAKTAFDPSGLLDELKKALAERALNAEIEPLRVCRRLFGLSHAAKAISCDWA